MIPTPDKRRWSVSEGIVAAAAKGGRWNTAVGRFRFEIPNNNHEPFLSNLIRVVAAVALFGWD